MDRWRNLVQLTHQIMARPIILLYKPQRELYRDTIIFLPPLFLKMAQEIITVREVSLREERLHPLNSSSTVSEIEVERHLTRTSPVSIIRAEGTAAATRASMEGKSLIRDRYMISDVFSTIISTTRRPPTSTSTGAANTLPMTILLPTIPRLPLVNELVLVNPLLRALNPALPSRQITPTPLLIPLTIILTEVGTLHRSVKIMRTCRRNMESGGKLLAVVRVELLD